MQTHQKATQAERAYEQVLDLLLATQIPFLIGGAYALRHFAGIVRDTKDLDVFCKASDYPRLLEAFAQAGYRTEVTDPTWLAKVFTDDDFLVDLIFSSANGLTPIDDSWFDRAPSREIVGRTVKLIAPEEVLWTKMFVQDRHRFDGADVLHLIRCFGDKLDWRHLLVRMEPHWEVLLAHLVEFQFVYPSDLEAVPRWLMDELLQRCMRQQELPVPREAICRGSLFSRTQYEVDIREWGYKQK